MSEPSLGISILTVSLSLQYSLIISADFLGETLQTIHIKMLLPFMFGIATFEQPR